MRGVVQLGAFLVLVAVVVTGLDLVEDGGPFGAGFVAVEFLEHALLIGTMAFVAWCSAAYYTIQASDRLD